MSDTITKKNVSEFNRNVQENGGFLYTTNAQYSSYVANKRISEEIFKHIKPQYKTLVDVGCGDGVYTDEIKKNFPHLQVFGFDPATEAIETASQKFPDVTFQSINILDDRTVAALPKYDVAVIRGVLHHLPDQAKAIENALKLADNLIVMEPNGNNPVLKLIEKTSKYHIEHEEQSFHYFTMKGFFQTAGGKITSWAYVGYVPFFFPTGLSKIIHFCQPFLEKIPILKHFFSAQYIITAQKAK